MPARPLILASTSAYRRELLARLGVEFTCIAPGVIEDVVPGESPPARARRLALEKARAVAARHPGALVAPRQTAGPDAQRQEMESDGQGQGRPRQFGGRNPGLDPA